MRIKTGSQVEVWTQEAGSPVGAWRVGVVTWGNGHSYTLRWQDGGPESGRISRKCVRPRPPPAPVPMDLDAGDMVEVLDEDDCLWKCAEVQRAAVDGDRQFHVKIVGAAKVLTVAPDMLRVRQVLRDDDVWVALHRDNQIAGPSAMPIRANGGGIGRGRGCYKPAMAPGFKPLVQKRSFGMLGSNTIANGMRFEDTAKRLCVNEEPRYGVEAIVPNVCLNKQDEMSSSKYSDVVGTGGNYKDDHHQQQQYEDDDDDSESSSSSDGGSSSSSSDSRTRRIDAGDNRAEAPASRPCDDHDADQLQQRPKREHCDDIAESRVNKKEHLNDEEAAVVKELRGLELQAYTALMEAFHACGDALSWEKVDLLTNLRQHLHISNDEHLQVINEVLNRKGRFRRPDKF